MLERKKFTVYTVKEIGGKPDRKPYPLPFGLRIPYRTLKIIPRNINEIVCSRIRIQDSIFSCSEEEEK
jgi:hypothetical protein